LDIGKERSVDVGPGRPGGLVDVLHGAGYAVCYNPSVEAKRGREPEMPWIVGVLQEVWADFKDIRTTCSVPYPI
jgi:hypothetical protein